MEFSSNQPIYLQLMELIQMEIVSGKRFPGQKLPSVRDLALEYGVNPNTVQKALSELEGQRLVFAMRTTGRYVTEDVALIGQLRQELARQKIQAVVGELWQLGYSRTEMQQLLKQYMEDMKELSDNDNTGLCAPGSI